MTAMLEQPDLRRQVIPLSVEAYHALGEMGFIEENSELLHGFIFAKMPKSPLHYVICARLLRAIRAALTPGLSVRQEQPLTTQDSEPEPDVAVVIGEEDSFAHSHPSTAALVIEVSLTTLDRDQEKAAIYAAAGVDEYWIIRPDERVADIYTQPSGNGYAQIRRIEHDGVLSPAALPSVSISMEALLKV